MLECTIYDKVFTSRIKVVFSRVAYKVYFLKLSSSSLLRYAYNERRIAQLHTFDFLSL